MSNQSNQPEISQQEQAGHVWKANNPHKGIEIVASLYKGINVRRDFTSRYGLYNGSFEILVILSKRWLLDNKGSTVYSLSPEPKRNTNTAVAFNLARLLDHRLIDVLGTGKNGCRVYCPTAKALGEVFGISAALQ